MKTVVAILLIILTAPGAAVAMPTTPIWAMPIGFDDQNNRYFVNDPIYANRLFPNNEMNYLKVSSAVSNGIRVNIGYDFGRNDTSGNEKKSFIAGIDKQLNENWRISVGYQNGNNLLGSITVGSIYNITPNVSVSAGYSLPSTYDLKSFVTTQLYIKF